MAGPQPSPASATLPETDPVPTLLQRLGNELPAAFDLDQPIRVSRAPGRLDVMGGIADYTGSLVCPTPLQHAAAVAMQARDDREIQVFSFNLFDQHIPFTLRISLDDLASASAEQLHHGFAEPGRRWAAYPVGCLFVLHEQKYVDLRNPTMRGLNLAIHSSVPMRAGLGSNAAVEVATMINLLDHLGIPRQDESGADGNAINSLRLAELCQEAEQRIAGVPCGIMDQLTSCIGRPGELLRIVCQPHSIQPPLAMPAGIRVIGIHSGVKQADRDARYRRTRCAAFMGQKMILEKMAEIGAHAGRQLVGDPMRGYLANLPLEDYKRYFRQFLPESTKGLDYLEQYGPTDDPATVVDPDEIYPVLGATDHHVFESRRIRNFSEYLEQAGNAPAHTAERSLLLDKAGHLMYASQVAYTVDAELGDDACELLVDLVRRRESAGFYGARITGGGCGGTVAVLANEGDKTDAAIAELLGDYQAQSGHAPQLLVGSSPGAWHFGTTAIRMSR